MCSEIVPRNSEKSTNNTHTSHQHLINSFSWVVSWKLVFQFWLESSHHSLGGNASLKMQTPSMHAECFDVGWLQLRRPNDWRVCCFVVFRLLLRSLRNQTRSLQLSTSSHAFSTTCSAFSQNVITFFLDSWESQPHFFPKINKMTWLRAGMSISKLLNKRIS